MKRTEENWVQYGKCLGTPDLFELTATKDQRKQAVALCRNCPVLTQCFEDARDAELTGVIQAGLGWRGGEPVNAVSGQRLRKGGSPSKKEGYPPPPHGTVKRYAEFGCRCEGPDGCRAAKARSRHPMSESSKGVRAARHPGRTPIVPKQRESA